MQTKSEPTEVISPEKDVENLISLGCQLNIWVYTKKKELATINSDVMSCNKDFTVGTRKKLFSLDPFQVFLYYIAFTVSAFKNPFPASRTV